MIPHGTISKRLLTFVLVSMFILPWMPTSSAQTSLGNEFIVFVEGKNVLVPFFDGTAAVDPTNASNTVANFAYSDWAAPGFRWDNAVGVDMTGMVGASVAQGGATMYVRLLVSDANKGAHLCGAGTGDDCLSLTLFDGFTGNQFADNREGRLKWFIPDSLRDGQWHDLAIPLPPSTVDALDAAKLGKNVDGSALATPLDPLAKYWEYTGGWAGGWGWGGTSGSPHGTADAVNWQPFEWNNIRGLSVHYDYAGGGGGVMIDNLYFGSATTDISTATSAPSAMSGVTFAANGNANKVSWTPNPDFVGYRVYLDEQPITTERIASGAVPAFQELAFNAPKFEVDHNYEIPHSSMLPLTIYYAVTSINLFGVANNDVSASSGQVSNTDLREQAFIVEIDNAGSDLIFNSLGVGFVTDSAFPAHTVPFRLDKSHSRPGDGGILPATEEDLSAMFKVGFNRTNNELYIYGEVTDDVLSLHPGTGECPGCDAWGYDSVEFGWGSYDVRDAGGSVLGGAPHSDFKRGVTPDYQGRIAWIGDDSNPNPNTSATFVTTGSATTGQGNSTGGGSVFGILRDGSGTAIGYKFLTMYNFSDFVFPASGDQAFQIPGINEVKLIPFNLAINDGDDAAAQNPRDLQIQWSIKPTANAAWWNTPSQWMTVAVVGAGVIGTDIEDDLVPNEFSLSQNYPNPFNPSTSIEFSLSNSENVSLTVYNVLGQQVATLINNQTMISGKHSVRFDASHLTSGMYFYRLDAGASYSKTLSMMLMK